MSEIKVVLYKDNRSPRTVALSLRMIYKTLFASVAAGLLIVVSLSLAAKYYLLSRAKLNHTEIASTSMSDSFVGPGNSLEDQNRSLRDQLDQLNAQVQNAKAASLAPRELDKKNPALALFSPVVVDKQQNQDQVQVANFKYSRGNDKVPATLTFELHNAHPGESTEKGYIVVLARGQNGLLAYPNVFNKSGPYLLDFEKGETFQVARFRLVNAQFSNDAQNFQILIFTRTGELLVNMLHEAK